MDLKLELIKLMIGLGNPGKNYENAYHNAGFLFIDWLTKNRQVQSSKFKVQKSEVYMNESGLFIAKTLKKYGAKPEELLIVHDDSDIGLGNYKLSFGRGAAGHHGVENIIAALKTKNFWRLRIGIRPVADSRGQELGITRKKASQFVLKKISRNDMKTLRETFARICMRKP